jgi:hypothetical protein
MTEEVQKVDEKPEEKVVEKEAEKPAVEAGPKLSEQEQSAVSYGWMPREEWVKAGHDDSDWVPAKHFLKFGELKQQVITKDKQVTKQDKIIKMMKDHHLKVKQTAYEEAYRAIKKEREAALNDNDLAAAERLKDQMEELKERHSKEKVLPKEVEEELQTVEAPAAPAVHPEFYNWHAKNPWYIAQKDKQDEVSRTADRLGIAMAEEARWSGEQLTVSDLYKAVEKEIKKLYPQKFNTPKSPQGDGPSGSGHDKGGSKVKLSDEELQVAKAFGLTPEKYIEQQKRYKGR